MPFQALSLRNVLPSTVLLLSLMGCVETASAVSFRPDVLGSLRSSGALPQMVAASQAAQQRGLDRPPASARGWLRRPEGGRTIPDRNAIVILVDFSDNEADQQSYPVVHYEQMLFSVGAYPTGSMRDWYLENSYGQFNVTGAVTIWLRMPQTYAYYVDGQAGFGTYPRNAQKLAEDAVVAADLYVDFSQFDNDGPDGIPNSGDDDGVVDALFVVHAGPGREETGSDNDIHSHAWSMANPQQVDGVIANGYSMEPENGKRGVFGHEFGHVLGLPDLYDTDYSSSGVGSWCMMSFGSWGGGGLTPTHFLAWCKARLDFLDPTAPRVNVSDASLPQVETNPTSFHLWTAGYPEKQYFVVENRQRAGSDVSLPGAGLVICHVDENVPDNTDENHPLVAVEQADGLNELAHGGPSNPGDPWPGSTQNRNFTVSSNPSTRDYAGDPTQVAVKSISDSGPIMTANLEVENAPAFIFQDYGIQEVTGNGDGDVDPGEQWDMPVTIYNRGITAYQVTGSISTASPDVSIQSGNTSFGTVAGESQVTGTPPFRLTLAPESTTDGLPFTVQVGDLVGHSASFSIVLGVNDPLNVFRWEHGRITPGYGDQWHISMRRNHTPGGSYSWKCGDPGTGTYDDRLDAALYSRLLPLGSVRALRFWHWIDAEDDVNFTAWDGGILEASVDGGPWTQITPDGGYPYTIIPNPDSPFPGGTPCFSGTFDWSEVRFDLTGLSGQYVRLRFRFGSDGYVTQEGWHIDDVNIEGTIPTGLTGPLPTANGSLVFAPPVPNPSSGAVTLRFLQPAGQEARVFLADPSGRRLRTWTVPAPAGTGMVERRLLWDGRLMDGSPVPSGVYFVRVEGGKAKAVQRLLRLR